MELRRVYHDSVYDRDRDCGYNLDPHVSVELWAGRVVLLHLALSSRTEADASLDAAVGELSVYVETRTPMGGRKTATVALGWTLLHEVAVADAIRLAIATLDTTWGVVYERVHEYERSKANG